MQANTTTKEIKGVTILGAAESYSLFNASGHMERNTRVKLAKGVKIYAVGYAGITQQMVIYDNDMNAVEIYTGEADPAKVCEYEADPESGHYFGNTAHVDELCRPWSQKFGIGFYYDESGIMVADEVINRSLLHARAVEAAKAANVKKSEEEFNAAKEATRAKYAGILEEVPSKYTKEGTQMLKRNISALVKHNFPGLRFSIRKDWHGYTIAWTDGPTADQMQAVAGLFEETCTRDRYNDDLWEYSDTAFTAIWGGVENINTDRKISEELEARAAAALAEALKGDKYAGDDTDKFRMFANSLGANITHYNDGYSRNEWPAVIARYTSAYVKPEPKPAKAKQTVKAESDTIKANGLQLVDYSEKAIAIIGDTRTIKEQLKALGGRFNARLSCGAGWIFSKRKENELKALLAL